MEATTTGYAETATGNFPYYMKGVPLMNPVKQYMVELVPHLVDEMGLDRDSLIEETALQFGLNKDGVIPMYLYAWTDRLEALYYAYYPSSLWAHSFLKGE